MIFLITIVSLLIGYALGRFNKPEEKTIESIQRSQAFIAKKIEPTVVPGIIKRPTAQELLYRNDPKKEEKEEVEKSLDELHIKGEI